MKASSIAASILLNGYLGGIITSPAVASAAFIESKFKNPFISTACKIIQILPAVFILGCPAFPLFAQGAVFNISLLTIPIIFKALSEIHSGSAVKSAEKVFMTIIKTINIASISLALITLPFMLLALNHPLASLGYIAYFSICLASLVYNLREHLTQPPRVLSRFVRQNDAKEF